MDEPSPHDAGREAAANARPDPPGQPAVIGIALAAVLTAAFAQGSWQWFSTYIGVTLLALVLIFYRLPARTPGPGSAYARNLIAYAMVVGLCVAIALAPALQRRAWLFPMPGTRDECPALGAYAAVRAEAALGDLADRDPAALARAREAQRHEAVADCLSATTTLWLPVYGAGAAVLAGLGAWALDRARTRKGKGTAAAPGNAP
ncbi:hypothetical protein [Streptomyces sp. NPDC014894]|uniref:hypothetical protein n=1 Tax=Streptomyces sp. NPDC014894 TaxID=3364931 RepID=UPI0036FB1E28